MSTDVEKGKALLSEAFIWKTRLEKAQGKFNELKRKLGDYMKASGESSIEVLSEGTSEGEVIVAKFSERVSSLKYDVNALKAALGDDIFSEVVQKTYVITDIDKMVSLLKNAGVKPADFKKLIHVEVEPNKAAIQQLFAIGDITQEQLKGTYTATISQSVSISCKKKGKGDSD